MKSVTIAGKSVPALAQGAMRTAKMSQSEVADLISHLYDTGINFWDHADIYGRGECERLFGNALKSLSGMRDKLIIQSKCSIRPGEYTVYDCSYRHIMQSVDGILSRLQTDRLDYLLLHRPDLLMQPEEVAQAFDKLQAQGKVLHFGVSNHTPMQIQLLKTYVTQPIVVNQLEFSLAHTLMIDSPAYLNTTNERASMRDASVLDFCRLNGITIQCYSPFQCSGFKSTFIDNPDYAKLNEVLEKTGKKYGISKNAVALAWILRHPAKMQVITGNTNFERTALTAKGADIELTREEWYELYAAAGNRLP